MLVASFNQSFHPTDATYVFIVLFAAIPAYLALTWLAMALAGDRDARWLIPLGVFSLVLPFFLWLMREFFEFFLMIATLTLLPAFAPMKMSPPLLIFAAAVAVWAVALGSWCIGAGLDALGRSRAAGWWVFALGLAAVAAGAVQQGRDAGFLRGAPDAFIEGPWEIEANGHLGQLELHFAGRAWTGRLWLDAPPRWEPLSAISLDGDRLSFVRHDSAQSYRGVVAPADITGTFAWKSGNYQWRAWRKR